MRDKSKKERRSLDVLSGVGPIHAGPQTNIPRGTSKIYTAAA